MFYSILQYYSRIRTYNTHYGDGYGNEDGDGYGDGYGDGDRYGNGWGYGDISFYKLLI
jgi:hypothetical protein